MRKFVNYKENLKIGDLERKKQQKVFKI